MYRRLNTREVRYKEKMAKQRIQLIETLIQRDPTYKPPTGAGAGGGESAAVLAAAGAANCGRCCELRPQSSLYCLAVATCRLHPPPPLRLACLARRAVKP